MDELKEKTENGKKTKEAERRTARTAPPVRFSVLGSASALYALFYTFCLYKNASGITYPFFVAGTLYYFFFCMKSCRVPSGEGKRFLQGKKERAQTVFYVGSLLLLGLSVCLTADWKILWMTKLGIFLLILTQALRMYFDTAGWSFTDWLCRAGRSLAELCSHMNTPFADAGDYFSDPEKQGKYGAGKYVLLGLAAAVPLLLLVLALLLSADAVFERMVMKLIGELRLTDIALICLLAFLVYVVSYSFIRGLVSDVWTAPKRREKRGEPVAAITFTLLLALVYVVFCAVQIFYLFWGRMELPAGLTWAGYARQGFFQLLFVCLINLILVLACLAIFRESRVLKGILTAISLMTYILIASSAYRMLLYIQNYYLTFLRVLVLWALLVIAVVFAGVIVSIWKEAFPLFSWCTAGVTVLYLILAFARPDYWVAAYDASHVMKEAEAGEGYDDYGYLGGLSADAAPALVKYGSDTKWYTYPMQDYRARILNRSEKMSLRSFNLSLWQAERSLEAGSQSG
ncbi:MAG: DUF4173 domain-containing protein [Eubacteriales bacterium]|nr:DUF4173 domain-containing protein [Eubacteriales bacterium]